MPEIDDNSKVNSAQGDLVGYKAGELAGGIERESVSERRYKAGINREQADLIGFRLNDFVEENNPVRAVDAFVNSLDLRELGFTNTQADTNSGQPAYPPGMLLKLYLYGYQNRIRSTRNLARECRRNVEVMWLLEKLTPEYRTIGSFRASNSKPIRAVHKQFIQLCREWRLLGGKRVSVDGSHFRGNVSAKSFVKKARLEKQIEELEQEVQSWLDKIEQTDTEESLEISEPEKISVKEMIQTIAELEEKKGNNEALLQALNKRGLNQISRTDADAQPMSKPGQRTQGFNVQIAVDGENLLITGDDVTSNANDREELFSLAQSVKQALGVDKLDVLADAGYSSGRQFQQCYENDITPYVPIMTRRSLADGENRFKTDQFTYIKEQNVYVCPMGELLHASGKPKSDGGQIYRARKAKCDICEQREKCLTKKATIREIKRGEHQEILEIHEKHMKDHPEVMRERAAMVEHPFGTIKVRAGWSHFLVRGLEKVKGEWSLMALGYNLTRVLNLFGMDKFIEYCRARQSIAS